MIKKRVLFIMNYKRVKVEIRKTLPFHSLPSKPVFRTSVLVLNDAGGEEEDGNVRDVDDE